MELNNTSFPQPPETDYVLHRRFDRMGRAEFSHGPSPVR